MCSYHIFLVCSASNAWCKELKSPEVLTQAQGSGPLPKADTIGLRLEFWAVRQCSPFYCNTLHFFALLPSAFVFSGQHCLHQWTSCTENLFFRPQDRDGALSALPLSHCQDFIIYLQTHSPGVDWKLLEDSTNALFMSLTWNRTGTLMCAHWAKTLCA